MAAVPALGRATGVDRPEPASQAGAAHELFARHSGRVFRFCLSQLRSREEAEDAAQTTFLYAFRGLQRGVVPESELTWLLAIARNVCVSRHRSAARRGRVEVPRDLHGLQDALAAPERGGPEVADLADALAGMPENQRRALLLREWRGLSYGEIAADLETSRSAVEALVFRARRSLAERLTRDDRQDGRLLRGLDAGSLVAGAKSLFAGSAVKLAAAAAALAVGTSLAGGPLVDAVRGPSAPPATRAARPDARAAPVSAVAVRPAWRGPDAGVRARGEDGQGGASKPTAKAGSRPAVGAGADGVAVGGGGEDSTGAGGSETGLAVPTEPLDDVVSGVTDALPDLPDAPKVPLPDVPALSDLPLPEAPALPKAPSVPDVLP